LPTEREPNGRKRRSPTDKPGRHLLLTPERSETIITAVRNGMRLDTAALYSGVGKETFWRWLRQGRGEHATEPFKTFADDLDQALAQWEATKVLQISKAGDKQWQANAWLLERRMPNEYGHRSRTDVNVSVNLVASPEWLELETRLLTALQQHPEALADVLQALAQADVVDGEAVEVAEIAAA
jgi:transposase